MSAQITMSYEEFKVFEDAKEKSEAEIAELKKQVSEAKLGDPGSIVRVLADVTRQALQIARFAMANMSPEVIKGWPADSLRAIGLQISQLPDFTVDDRDFGLEMIHFADEIDRWDQHRKAKSA